MVFYASWLDAIKNLPREMQGEVLTAIIEYGLSGETTASLKPITKAMLALVKAQIDVNNKRYENSLKGGRHRKPENSTADDGMEGEADQNQSETKPEPNQNQSETKPEPNNVYVYDNDNVNNKTAKAVSETSDSAPAQQIDFQRIFDYFNERMGGKAIKPISRLTERRKAFIRARCSEYGLQAIYDAIDNAAKSPFLNGNNNRGWTADFDWLFRPNNFPKVLEGNYDKTDKPQQSHNEREKLASAVEVKEKYGHDDTSYGKFMVFLSEQATYICEHYVLPTRERYEKLIGNMGKRKVMDTVMALENNYYDRRKYTNLYETLTELNMGGKT